MTTHRWQFGCTLLAVAAFAAACGSDTTGNSDTGNNVPCTITMTGARSGPLTCSNVSAVLTASSNQTGFGLTGSSATDTLSVGIFINGAPTVHTYSGSTDANPSITLITPVGAWTTTSNDGSLSLDITSVKQVDTGAGLTGYEVHGTLTLTMAAEVSDGSHGPVSVTATF